jgi:predicted Zn-dependent peptidase
MKKIILIAVLFIIGFMNAQKLDRTKPPSPGPAPEIKIGSYESFQLENGLKVFVVENHKLPVVSFNLIIDRDPILEKENAGYVEFAGQLLKTGTKTKSKSQIDESIDFIGASFFTSSTNIFGSCLKKHSDKLLDIMSDISINAEFKQEELEKIKERTISSLKAEKDEPSSIAERIRKKIYYGEGHPYSETETEATVGNITLEMCKNYYSTYFKPNNSYLSIVGDITFSEAKELIQKYFSSWKSGEIPKFMWKKVEPPLINKVVVVDRSASVQSTIVIGHPIVLERNNPDVVKATITNTILGGGVFRLFENLREKHGYTYGAYSQLGSDELVGRFTASADVRNSVTDSAISEILYEMKRIGKELVEEKELQKAKNYLSGSFAISHEDPKTIANFAVNIERWKLPKDYYTNYLKNISAITPQDVLMTAKKYILPENSFILVVGKAEEISKTLKKFSVKDIIYYDTEGNIVDPNAQKVPEGLTADGVIDKYIQVIGGKENLMKIQDKTITMTAKVQNFDVKLEIFHKAPNKLLQKVIVMGTEQITLYDGTKGYQKTMMGEEELKNGELEQLKFEATMTSVFDYKSLSVTVKVVGIVKIKQKDSYKIEFTLPSGDKLNKYFETESGLLVREERTVNNQQGTFTLVTDFDDYREVSLTKIPYKVFQNIGGMTVEFTATNVQINSGVTDDLFIKK